jgi:regulator of sirC expression with transglutaminase-like and TPR domain
MVLTSKRLTGTVASAKTAKNIQRGFVMDWINYRTLVIVILIAVAIGPIDVRADEAIPPPFEQLIEQLGSKEFAVRQKAERKLTKIGVNAITPLRNAFVNESPEIRGRAKQLVTKLHFDPILRRFEELENVPDSKIDLEECMWLISRIVDHTSNRKSIAKQLDNLADQVRKKLGKDVDPKKADPKKVLAAIHQVMFVDNKFDGDHTATYDHPNNSSISFVLKERKGLPILLSHIMVAVAERLDFPLAGFPAPGRYMVKYDGTKAPKEFPTADIIINPFEAGETMTRAEFTMKWGDSVSRIANDKRRILQRMARNLESDCQVVSDLERERHAGRIQFWLLGPAP